MESMTAQRQSQRSLIRQPRMSAITIAILRMIGIARTEGASITRLKYSKISLNYSHLLPLLSVIRCTGNLMQATGRRMVVWLTLLRVPRGLFQVM